MISSIGGSHPVTFEAPVMVSRRGLREPVQFSCDVASSEGPVASALDVAALGYARPRQEIGVVFDDGRDDNVVGTQAQAVGQVVYELRSCCGR